MDDSDVKCLQMFTKFVSMLETKNPTIARIYRCKILDITRTKACDFNQDACAPYLCRFCGNADLETFSVRFSPRMSLKPKILRLLIKVQNHWRIQSKFQQNLVSMYRNSSTDMCVKCLLCKKTQKVRGPTREVLLSEKLEEISNSQKVRKIKETPLTTKQKQKLKKKMKQKKKRSQTNKQSFENITHGNASLVTMETDSSLDTLSVRSPLICSTPKPVSANKSSDSTEPGLSQSMVSGSSQSKSPKLPQLSNVKHDKLTNEKLSLSASLLKGVSKNTAKSNVTKSTKKKKKKDMHLQLLKILKKDQKNKKSKSSLGDFLSSL